MILKKLLISHLARRERECLCLYTDSRLKSGFRHEINDFFKAD